MESPFCKKVNGVYIADARRPKPFSKYEDLSSLADDLIKLGNELHAQIDAHEEELKGSYPLNTSVRILDSLYMEHYWPARNIVDSIEISHKHYPDVTGHE